MVRAVMRKICLIDDSLDVQDLIKHELSAWYRIHSALGLGEAKNLLAVEQVDLILLDVNFPDGNGFEFCAWLKNERKTKDVPVIFLTAKHEPLDKMMGFSLGADDYVVKPFDFIELRARIEARLRTSTAGGKLTEEGLRVGPLRFDLVKQRAYAEIDASERDLQLTPLEFKLLHFLSLNEGKIYSRTDLMKAVIESNVHVKEDNIYTHVCAVRKKLGTLSGVLECLPRVGYRVRAPAAAPRRQAA